MPAHIQMPVDPWGQESVSIDDSAEGPVGNWHMWGAPQLDQILLSSIAEPLNNWSYLGSRFLEHPMDSLRQQTQQQPVEPEIQLSAYLRRLMHSGCTSGDVLGLPPACNSQSLWSRNSAVFESAMRAWDNSDSHGRVRPEFLDCITQEIMKVPVLTSDGHSYEREAIERWLKTRDTNPITGEVLPPPQGGCGRSVDKSLRSNHILREQIIE